MNRKTTVHVVPHSHWDREWYFTIEDSNVILVENVDRLLDVMEGDPSYRSYVFDAQASVIEDYLAVRPENKERLKALIESRRIFIGPWYTQTDTLLVNTESVIRNLLHGVSTATEMGHSMQVGYLPDIFGQNAYLPSIFREFGIEHSVLQRGVYNDQVKKDLNFWWKSPDGRQVKTNYMFFGYGPGKFLEASESYFRERLEPILATLEERNQSTNQLLLPAGGDQVLVRAHFPQTIDWLNEYDKDREYLLSDYETFMKKTWAASTFENTITGELIASQKSRIHSTIRSHRIDIKQHNYHVENKLLYVLEPLACIASSLGLKYPSRWLDKVWKQLFDVHAHDSIGGCNSDDTNRSIEMRLTKAEWIIDGLTNVLKKQISRAVLQQAGGGNIALAFNFLPREQESLQRFVLFTKSEYVTLTASDGQAVASTIIKQNYISGGKQVLVTAEGEKEVQVPGYYRTVLLAKVRIPALGYTTLKVVEGKQSDYRTKISASAIQNDRYHLEWNEGSICLEDRLNGTTVRSLFRFEDVADYGDSYDFSPLEADIPIYSEACELVEVQQGDQSQTLTVRHRIEIPSDIEQRKQRNASQELSIETVFELRNGEDFVRVEHTLYNKARDHRVRVLFRHKANHTWADQAFTALRREKVNPHMENWKKAGFVEAPVSIYPLENYVVAEDEGGQLGLITQGIKEYELLEDELALTLFRSVGLLGRDDLAWRPGRASGINNKVVETPDAQLQKKLSFRYALHISNKNFDCADWSAMTEQYVEHETSYHLQALNTFEERLERFELPQPIHHAPAEFSLLSVKGDVFVSCTKRSEHGDGIVLRVFNPTEKDVSITVSSDAFRRAEQVTLAEEKKEQNETVVKAKGYMTLKFSS